MRVRASDKVQGRHNPIARVVCVNNATVLRRVVGRVQRLGGRVDVSCTLASRARAGTGTGAAWAAATSTLPRGVRRRVRRLAR